jgi:hypothetical protein
MRSRIVFKSDDIGSRAGKLDIDGVSLIIFLSYYYQGIVMANQRLSVFVSIVPQKYFLQQICKNLVDVQVLTPSGADPHTLNNKLQAVDVNDAKATTQEAARKDLEAHWNRWNAIRTAFASLKSALLLVLCSDFESAR